MSVKYTGIKLGRERLGYMQHSPGARTFVFAHVEQTGGEIYLIQSICFCHRVCPL